MWTRKELKERGKTSFRRNYWKSVLIAFILTIIIGGAGGFSSGAPGGMIRPNESEVTTTEHSLEDEGETNADVTGDENDVAVTDAESDGETEFAFNIDAKDGKVEFDGKAFPAEEVATFAVMMFVVFMIVFTAIMMVIIVLDVFIFNPLELGCRRFFFKNLDEPANMSHITYGFDHSYKNVAKIMFFRDLYVILWSMLCVIPGIIKGYEYRMIPYLLAENPEMSKEEAFAMSKKMMDGQKWKTFVLDLSFIGWEILSIFTCGILSIFYVEPYKAATSAALYEALRYGKSE